MKQPSTLLGQAIAFLIIGLGLAFLANAIHPAGITPSRDYFQPIAAEHGFAVLETEELSQLLEFLSPEEGGILLLDARDPESFARQHIPGALVVDHYHQEDYLPELLPSLSHASMVVVYCNGGDCEDSLFLAHDLVYQYGLMPEVIHVYEGGLEAWVQSGLETAGNPSPGDKK